MGYDFLGTFSFKQWEKLVSFSLNHLSEMSPTGDYARHLAAEVKRAQRTQSDLKKASGNFAEFLGDYTFNKELIPRDNPQYRYSLDDADTAVLVQLLKNKMKPILKRKKDNLEYRYKKFIDLEEQLGLKLNDIIGNESQLPLEDTLLDVINSIERHFVDGKHTHNLAVDGEKTDTQGMIIHSTTTLRVEEENTLL